MSYNGRELLAELVNGGHWIRWAQTVSTIVRMRRMRLRGVMNATFGPWVPIPAYRWLSKVLQGHAWEIDQYTAINQSRLSELDLVKRGRERGLDPALRPFKDGVAMRLGHSAASIPLTITRGSSAAGNSTCVIRPPIAV